MIAPQRPRQELVPGSPEHRLIRGVMRMDVPSRFVERVILLRAEAWTVALVDSGAGLTWSSGGDTALHILWQQDEDDGWVEVGGDRYQIAPGDTMSVPARSEVRIAAGMLLVAIEAGDRSLQRVLPPNHGVEAFVGFNRRTDYDTPPAFSMQRWKITHPLEIPASDDEYVVIGLAEPLALVWPGGTDLIGRGECRVIAPGVSPITLLPDGLGYALVVR